MGSSRSKPRKGHEHPQHLAKVGTPANREWEHETRTRLVFGSGMTAVLVGIAIAIAVIGVLLITL